MRRNAGSLDAYLRIAGGLVLLAWGTARLVREKGGGLGPVLILLGAGRVAQGLTGYCALLEVLGTTTTRHAPREVAQPPSRAPRRGRRPAATGMGAGGEQA